MDISREIILTRYKWQQAGCILATGYSRNEDTFVFSDRLAALVDSHSSGFEDFKALIGHLNGQFSMVADKEDEVWLTCSHTWSYPLFYRFSASGLWISDDPHEILARIQEKEIKVEIMPYFLNFGVTPRCDTLIRGIGQVRPGEAIRFLLKRHEKEHYLTSPERYAGSPKTEKETYKLVRKVFEKYSDFLKDKKVLVPLTGGYDSRLIACMFKENGHAHVTCATWGRSGNSEMVTAEKVAKILGFPYLNVPTGDKLTDGFWKEEIFQKYVDWSGHLSSMPYLQDYFAIRFLQETGVIDEDTVVLPGHPGDFLRGSHLYHALPDQDAANVIENISDNFGTSVSLTKEERTSVRQVLSAGFGIGDKPFDPVTQYENWDKEERQCKFIGNSSQVYSFFGISYMMPLFDKELLDYFLALPFGQRLGASLYNKTLENLVFKPLGCDFDLKPEEKEMKQGNKWKYFVLKWLPPAIKEWYYPMDDTAFYREITAELMRSDPENKYRKPLKSHYYNCYLTQWYLNQVEKQLSMSDRKGNLPDQEG